MDSFLEKNRSKLLTVAFVASVCIVALILFWNSIPGGYTMDDHSVIEQRIELQSIKNIPKIFLMPWHYNAAWGGNYRPLTLISYAINFFFSKSTAWLHITDIILYGLNVALIYYLAASFVSKRTALLTAAIFMFLPIHVEAVSSIVGRVYLLGSLFFFSSLLFYFKKKYLLSSTSFLLAVLASDFTIALLPIIAVLLLYESRTTAVKPWYRDNTPAEMQSSPSPGLHLGSPVVRDETRSFWKSLRYGLYYLPSVAVYFLFRYLALGKYAFLGGFGFVNPAIGPLAYVPLKERILTGFLYLFLYLRKTIYPVDLSPDYSYNQVPAVHSLFGSYGAVIGILFLLAVILIAVRGRRGSKIAAVFFLFPFALMSNIFFVTTGTMGERWWYLPSFGIVLLAAIGLNKLIGKWRKLEILLYVFLLLLFAWFSVLIVKQNRVWLNDRNLYMAAGERSPMSAGARTNVAAVYFQEGDYKKARQETEAALKIYDKSSQTLNLWAKINWREGNYQEAEDALKKALEYDSYGTNARRLNRTLALLELDLGKNKEALKYMEKARQSPTSIIAAGDVQLDDLLYNVIKKYENHTLGSYTEKEKADLNALIRTVLGF